MAERIWIVREGDGATVDEVVLRAGDSPTAIDAGRVFVGRKRAKRGDSVRVGDSVRIASKRDTDVVVAILHRARDLVVVDKPAGISTIPDEHDAEGSLLVRTARALGVSPESLQPTSRLDRGVSGVVVFTKTVAARERLHTARNSKQYFRQYAAISDKSPTPAEGAWSEPIGRARDPKKRQVGGHDAADALTRYRVVGHVERGALLAVEPVTGRTHQIRVHAAHAGAALLGDRDYGGVRTLVLPSGKVIACDRVALHCAHVCVEGVVDVRAPIPEAMRTWWSALGGDEAAWSTVTSNA